MVGVVQGYQGILLGTGAPDSAGLLPVVVAIGFFVLMARLTYRRFAGEMSDLV